MAGPLGTVAPPATLQQAGNVSDSRKISPICVEQGGTGPLGHTTNEAQDLPHGQGTHWLNRGFVTL